MKYEGACHCGGVGVEFETAVPPEETDVRACQCSFCRMHASRAVGDPRGRLRFIECRPGAMHRYRFGLKTADYVLCRECGAYLGAVLAGDAAATGIVNIAVLADRDAFTRAPDPAVFDHEDEAARIARRKANWTPVR
jgi:hypothetical protein